MDTLAHGLWTNVVFYRQPRRDRRWAVFFGVAPDLLSFGPYVLRRVATNTFVFRTTPPLYVAALYSYTHSLIVFAAVFCAVALWRGGRPWWPLLAWGLHIIADIFTHTYEFYPTPFLFPFSSWKASVLNWADPTFLVANYGLLAIVYLEMYRRYRKQQQVV